MSHDWSSDFVHEPRSCRRLALVVSGGFALLGITWLLTTDVLVYALTDNRALGARLHLATDWAFILGAAIAVFLLAQRAAIQLSEAHGVLIQVMRSIGDGLLVLGSDHTIVYANPAAVKMLECSDASQLVGMSAGEFSRQFLVSYPSGELVTPESFVSQRAFTEPGSLHYKAVLHPGPDDELVIISSAAGVRDDPDEPARLVVSVMHDITSEEHLEQMRDRFFSGAAHALKTPVAIIKANAQLMARSPHPNPASMLAVQRQCDRIDLLVQNLLIISRARTRTLQLYPERLELPPLMENAAHDFAVTRLAEVVVQVVESAPIRGDHERLQLVVRNLVHEALLAARPKTPLVLRLAPSGQDLELDVQYVPLPVPERAYTGAEDHDDTELARCANTTIIRAHGGATGEHEVSEDEARLWIRLPRAA